MSRPEKTRDPLALVHEGWDHLKRQRPLAAWASWQRALRVETDQVAAAQALKVLAESPELPKTAKLEYRFKNPSDPTRRERWNTAFKDRDLSELQNASEAFTELMAAEPTDVDAIENLALCLAWQGSPKAISTLAKVVELTAGTDYDRAVNAWKLAEVLRQGAGAETLASDFSHAILVEDANRGYERLQHVAELRRLPSPPDHPDLIVEEWLDRPWPTRMEGLLWLEHVPRVVAVVFSSDRLLRLSIPSWEGLATAVEVLDNLGVPTDSTRTPLPMATLDAAVWTIRLPEWLDDESRHRLYRENVEDFYENRWIKRPRAGLDGSTPLIAASQAQAGDLVVRAKLEATIAIREELAARATTSELYQGYPFDRLRKRLGIPLLYPEAVDDSDKGCMTGNELDALDLSSLDDQALADAFRSAASLGNDARTSRFAKTLLDRESALLARMPLKDLFAPLIRASLDTTDTELALDCIDQAIAVDRMHQEGRNRQEFTTWKAELYSRVECPDDAVDVYEDLITESSSQPWTALDAAATLLDDGHLVHARAMAELAIELAEQHDDRKAREEAERFLHVLDD
jgi:hypothetical protein